MDSPSRASGSSSPDPLNESAEQTAALSSITSSARVTRSQQPSSLYSLDLINSARKKTAVYGLYANSPPGTGFGAYVSPRKQTFRLDVGSGRAQQTIRVTVEAEGQDENDTKTEKEVNRRLFPSLTPALPPAAATTTTTRRRQASTSPAKPSSSTKPSRAKARKARTATPNAVTIATTTKVPLRGLSDDESTLEEAVVATPKPRRGRPRRSGTPIPTAAEAAAAIQSSPMPLAGTDSPSKLQQTPVPRRRGRPPRATTPKANGVDEEEETTDELASVAATPTMPHSVVRRTPHVTPKSKSTAKSTSTKRSTARKTSKRTASTAFPLADSDGESVAESIAESTVESRTDVRPRKRGRGRPRRQAMTPQEMAVIAERDELAVTTAESASPGPTGYTDNSQRGYSATASPAPTMLSSVDLINVRTPARQSEIDSRAHSPATVDSADEEDVHSDMPSVDHDQTPRAPSEEIGVMPVTAEEQPVIEESSTNNMSNTAPMHDDQPNASAFTTQASGDELDDMIDYGGAGEDYGDDLLFYDEAAYAEDIRDSRQDIERPLLNEDYFGDSANTAGENNNTTATPTRKAFEKSPGSQRHPSSRPSSRRLATSPSALLSTPTPGSSQRRRRTMRVPVSARAALESDGEVDVVSASAQSTRTQVLEDDADELQAATSDGQSDPGEEEEGATVRRRDFDTIAQGEDFSMIGMESLQASFNLLHPDAPPSDLSEMGEMTSRIVSHSLASLRQQRQQGNDQPAGRQDHDGMSMLDFLYQSSPATSARAPAEPLQAAAVSPRKKAEPLTKVVARKALLQEAQPSPGPIATDVHNGADRSVKDSTNATETAEQAKAAEMVAVQAASQRLMEYDDSFSEIPDSVLAAVVPETMESVSGHHAAPTNDTALPIQESADALPGRAQKEGDDNDVVNADDAVDDNDVADEGMAGDEQQQPEAEMLSSPPIHQYVHHVQQATPVPALAPAPAQGLAPLFARDGRTPTAVSFLSPRFPVGPHGGSSEQPANRLHFPADGIRPSLSPIVRAGRALQSVTSDPPTPKESEGYLRSPFRRSVTRDTQSPAAAASSRHNSSTPDPLPQEDGPGEDQEPAATVLAEAKAADEEEYGLEEDPEDNPAGSPQDGSAGNPESSPDTQQPPAVATPSQPQQSPAPRRRWSAVALASLNGFKSLVANGAQIISPRLRGSASASPVASPSRTLFSTTAAPSKRSAADANLDDDPDENVEEGAGAEAEAEVNANAAGNEHSYRSAPRAKRARLDGPPSAEATLQLPPPPRSQGTTTPSGRSVGGGAASSSQSWRARLFREEGVAESFVGLAEAGNDHGERHRTAVAPTMASEGNSTEYGSDAIMNMINDISCEEPEQGADTSVVNAEGDASGDQTLEADYEGEVDNNGSVQDDDFDIWAIEAERTTRVSAPVSAFGPARESAPAAEPVPEPVSEPASEPASRPTPIAAAAPLRDPRLSRLLGSARKRGGVLQSGSAHAKGMSLRGEEDTSCDYSLLDDNKGEPAAQAAQGQSGRFLDNFFSSPVAVPQLLPPTSEHNIKFNEQSRLQAIERMVEHERGRAAREQQGENRNLPAVQTDANKGVPWTESAGSLSRPVQDTTADASPENTPTTRTAMPANTLSTLDNATRSKSMAVPSSLASTARQPLVRKDVNTPKTVTVSEGEALDESYSDAPSENEPYPELPQQKIVLPSDIGGDGSEQPATADLSTPTREEEEAFEQLGSVTNREQRQSLFAAPSRPIRPIRPIRPVHRARDVFSFDQQSSTPTQPQPQQQQHQVENTADLFLYGAPSPQRREPIVFEKPSPASRLWQGRRPSLFAPAQVGTTVRNIFFEEEPVRQRQQQQQAEEDDDEGRYEEDYDEYDDDEDELSREEPTEESSFLTPILKPLPDKSASPTKSCIRPATKPKTPGRVVEFTSSTMTAADASAVADAEMDARADAVFGFSEQHYGLGTNSVAPVVALAALPAAPAAPPFSTKVPAFLSAFFTSSAPAPAPEPAQNEMEDNDVEMTDVEMMNVDSGADSGADDEVAPDSTPVSERSVRSEAHDASPDAWDGAQSDALQEGPPPMVPQQQQESSVLASSSPASTPQRLPPLPPPPPPQPSWTVDDWTALGEMLQAYRTEGPLKFGLRRLPVSRPRTSMRTLLNKVVRAQQQAMLVKRWHLDVVDAFVERQRRQAGLQGPGAAAVPSEAYVLRRLFSLLIGEARRGASKGVEA